MGHLKQTPFALSYRKGIAEIQKKLVFFPLHETFLPQ
jgi:hypothetical protein